MLTFYRLLLWPDLGHEVAPNLIPGVWVIKMRSEKDLKRWVCAKGQLPSNTAECVHAQLYPTLAALWTVACPLSMGFSRQEYWSALPFPSHHIETHQGLLSCVCRLLASTLSFGGL